MNKTRVHELAQKLGIDNKELIAKFQAVGVDVSSHMSVVTEEDITKLSPPSPTVKETSQEEIRVRPTVIRRRPKAVDETVVASPDEATAPSPPAEEVKEEKIAAEVTKATPKREEAKPAVQVPVESKPAVEESKPAPEEATPTQTAPPEPEKHVPGRARIIGRVEIPIPPQRQPHRTSERQPAARPPRAEVKEAPVPAAQEPAVSVDDRKKGRKGKEVKEAPAVEMDRAPKKIAAAGKKKDTFKKVEIIEKRERVFEPSYRAGKGKRKEKDRGPDVRKTEITVPKAIKRIIKISESITVGEMAKRMGVKANDLIRALMKMGFMTTINHPLDFDTATIIAADFGYEVENVAVDLEDIVESVPDSVENLEKRPPVVTIMGHVDHGKTSLLDAIRTTNVIAGEAGGITQHIGAYDVELKGRKITFLDTPGHEAFTAMRARGAKVTDIVILVVAADDGVMPQTREAVNHSQAAGVPIIIAINKIDKPDSKPERVKQELMEFGLVSEEWGGDTIFVEVSAKQKTNLEELLEMVLLQADVLELTANPNKPARGTIVEAKLDKGRGPVATVLVQEGSAKVGDYFVCGVHYGRIRAMQNDRGEKVPAAGPSMPVEVIGLTGVPDAGDAFIIMPDERQAKEIAMLRQQKMRETELAKSSKLSLEQLYEKIQMGEVKELNVVVKGDVQGSVEAVSESLRKLSTDAIRLRVINSSVGAITETDVNLATASNAIVLGFNVRPEVKAQALAEKEGVDIRLYNIIYDAVDDIKKAMEGLLEPTLKEKYLGRAEIREVFSVPKHGNVAGSYVLDGKMIRNSQVRLLRDNIVVYEGKMASLRRFKDDIKEVAAGYECGISLENYNDIKPGDIIESFEIEKVATTL
ncbi:MAG: translation initiation factor IF-2 [Deltaproteobacteria bacterium]|nr:translation initiation factor IF-2 [Deltaproteobacteria bacterium]TLN03777.1 MAG: translation initiation factor IF-2 [bacterium]